MAEPVSLFDIEDDEAEERALLEAEAELDAGKGEKGEQTGPGQQDPARGERAERNGGGTNRHREVPHRRKS